jgi:hypothetical protein
VSGGLFLGEVVLSPQAFHLVQQAIVSPIQLPDTVTTDMEPLAVTRLDVTLVSNPIRTVVTGAAGFLGAVGHLEPVFRDPDANERSKAQSSGFEGVQCCRFHHSSPGVDFVVRVVRSTCKKYIGVAKSLQDKKRRIFHFAESDKMVTGRSVVGGLVGFGADHPHYA